MWGRAGQEGTLGRAGLPSQAASCRLSKPSKISFSARWPVAPGPLRLSFPGMPYRRPHPLMHPRVDGVSEAQTGRSVNPFFLVATHFPPAPFPSQGPCLPVEVAPGLSLPCRVSLGEAEGPPRRPDGKVHGTCTPRTGVGQQRAWVAAHGGPSSSLPKQGPQCGGP